MTEKTPNYMPQLDGLRAFAVLGVIASHSLPHSAFSSVGPLGVRLFFVLSGFLITRILLRARSSGGGISQIFYAFYARRILRIFPAYYVAIGVMFALGLLSVATGLWWHVAYLTNVYISIEGGWIKYASHFWTLAVEEQFYFVWPAVMLLLPAAYLKRAILLSIAIAPLFRIAVYAVTRNTVMTSVLVVSNLDCLAGGALLALVWESGDRAAWLRWRSVSISASLLALIYTIAYSALDFRFQYIQGVILFNTMAAATSFWVIDAAAVGFGGVAGLVLSNPAVRYIGRISYGMYIYHMLAIIAAERVGLESGAVMFAVATVATIAVAATSWAVIEKPINSFKDRFPYTESRRTKGAPTQATGEAAS
jgi:peptidoglycan/LPS O-acetylase OafA/YrhL